MMSFRLLLFALLLLAISTGAVLAQPQPESTRVVVHAVANDAKILHDGVGGALIRITNTETGEVLAEGVQRGTSGDTGEIMRQPQNRGESIYDTPKAAHFSKTLALSRPTTVRVTAMGPLDYPTSQQQTSKTLTLLPGHDMTGDGLVLTLHGFIVEVLSPTDPSVATGETIDVRARVRMICGCPTEPGGLWDANRYTIQAELVGPGGGVVAEAPLSFTGTTSEYEGSISVPASGATQLRVVAVDGERANAGSATIGLAGEAE